MTTSATQSEWRAGWPIVLGAAIGSSSGLGLLFYVTSLFVLPVSEAFGWTRGQIGAAIGLSGIGTFAAPAIGWMVDRFGLRPVITVCHFALSACYVGLATMEGSYALFVALLVGIGVFGIGTIGFVYSRPVAAAFDRSRGLALGVAATGVALTAIVATPLLQVVISEFGWRAGYWMLAGFALLFGLPLALLLLRPKLGGTPSASIELAQDHAKDQRSSYILEAMRSPVFWLLALAIFCVNTAGSGALSQLSPLLMQKGLSAADAALGITAFALGLMLGRLGCGALLDHLPTSRVAFVFTLWPVIGALVLLQADPLVYVALAASLMLGLQQGSELDVIAVAISRTFGILRYTSIFGVIYVAGILGNTFGAFAFGALFDLTQSYDLAIFISAGMFAVGSLCFLFTGVGVVRGPAPPSS